MDHFVYSQRDVIVFVSLTIVLVFVVAMVIILSIVASRWRNVRDDMDGLTDNAEIATDMSVWSVHGTYNDTKDGQGQHTSIIFGTRTFKKPNFIQKLIVSKYI